MNDEFVLITFLTLTDVVLNEFVYVKSVVFKVMKSKV
jgi:hypothetical protein